MPSPVYSLIEDYSDKETLSVDPYWAILIIPQDGAVISFSRKTLSSIDSQENESSDNKRNTILITSDCVNLNISNSKDSHIKKLTATILHSNTNYLTKIVPGDYVMSWIVNDSAAFSDLLGKIKAFNAANEFLDGFKFLGKVNSISKNVAIDSNLGNKNISYSLDCDGFKEFETQFYYDFRLSDNLLDTATVLSARIGKDLTTVYGTLENDNSEHIILNLLDILLGTGVPESIKFNLGEEQKLNPTAGSQAQVGKALLIPNQVGKLLGVVPFDYSRDNKLSYADVLKSLAGVQAYPENANANKDYGSFLPEKIADLLGLFFTVNMQFSNLAVWEVLNQYINHLVSEMYTCIRVNRVLDANNQEQFRVFPTLVLRQNPFTTDSFDPDSVIDTQTGNKTNFSVTRFSNLPRWKITSSMVQHATVGRSDATRCNFVELLGDGSYSDVNLKETQQLARNPPLRDDIDIAKSGLRSKIESVTVGALETFGSSPTIWNALVADRAMGSHLTLNGSVTSVGIHAPICEGDNLEWDDFIYHIESISHACNINLQTGHKKFTTSLNLTNGIQEGDDNGNPKYLLSSDLIIPQESPSNTSISEFEAQPDEVEVKTLPTDRITQPELSKGNA